MVRAGRLSIGLSVIALAGVAVGSADADITIDAGVAHATVPTPPVTVPVPGHGPVKIQPPNVQVTVPRGGGRPSVIVNPGTPVAPPPSTPTPPVATPPTPDPPGDQPPSGRSNDPPAADPQPASSTPAATTTTATPATPAHAPAAKTSHVAQSHTIAPITRSGHSDAHRRQASAPHGGKVAPRSPAVTPPARTTPRTIKRAPHAEAAPKKEVPKAHEPRSIGNAIGDAVEGLPGWVLGIFVGFAALAVAMAIDAYANSRRARRLTAQRAELVDDVGHLQAALLASVPETPGDATFSVAYRPAAGLAAGGDFYDVFALDAHRTAIVLGDISGHGRESVAHAALVRYTLRTFIAAGHGPAEAITLTDPCLDGHLDGQFATVIAAVYDHVAHAITYATAGHHPPLLLGVDREPPRVAAAPPIGAGLGGTPTDISLALAPGTTVCFFTDGLVEARRAGRPLGAERVAEMLAEAPDDAEALIAAVAADADAVNDDLAVCLLHRPGEEPSIAPSASDPLPLAEPVGA
jgi:hypothetical protein